MRFGSFFEITWGMQHKSLFVFDIETVPDTDAVPNLTGFEDVDAAARRDELARYHLEITDGRNDFPRQPFHKVVAISFLEAEIEHDGINEQYFLKELRSGGRVEADEEELLKGFFQYFERAKPRLVSFNGRNFDLPVLKFRAMKYGISCPALYKSGDKWNSYTSRYSSDWHCDLLDVLKDHGAMGGGLKLNEVCAILGLPGKFGVDGSKVSDMFDAGQVEEIRAYCETDVLNTYLVYLYWQMHNATLNKQSFSRAIQDVLTYIDEQKGERAYLGEFFDAWNEACNGRFVFE